MENHYNTLLINLIVLIFFYIKNIIDQTLLVYLMIFNE
jgi:hypothetical protein